METKILDIFIISILIVSVLGFQGWGATSDEHTTSSNVTIANYVAIGLSTNLSTGILFGTLDPDTTNNNATHNYDGENTASTYSVDVSTDSNINIDLCIKDNAPLTITSSGFTIENGNYTWADNSTANSSSMNPANSYVIGTTYQKTNTTNIAGGESDYIRFWLDVMLNQAPGNYNNTIHIKGVVAGGNC
ncbi:MAG: hypothetical protein KAI55_02550 [Candidatus Aenigmarchaeota archaeon]|nr:hypothetical protein [Candidatus Aenigmarchaeota archaeon]